MSFGSPAAERAALEGTYEDTAAISRRDKIRIGEITAARPAAPIYSEIVCGLSMAGGDQSTQTAAQQSIRFDAKLFLPPDVKVLPGDFVAVRRFGRDTPGGALIEFEAVGRPKEYATHTEVLLRERDLA